MNEWENNLKRFTDNVKRDYKKIRKNGTSGMSIRNFRQIVDTKGITIPPAQFDRLLECAINQANIPNSFFY